MEGKGLQQMFITKFKFVPPPLIRLLYAEVAWESSCGKVLLTIDDSPSEDTTRVLDLLDQHQIKSVFFVNVPKTEKNKNVVKEIVKRGHLVANHGMTHKKLRSLSPVVLHEQIVTSKQMLEDITGTAIKYFRPPYGAFDLNSYDAIIESGQRPVMWTLLTGDYLGDLRLSTSIIKKYLGKKSIVVMHDNPKSKEVFEGTLQVLVQTVDKKGSSFGGADECLK